MNEDGDVSMVINETLGSDERCVTRLLHTDLMDAGFCLLLLLLCIADGGRFETFRGESRVEFG